MKDKDKEKEKEKAEEAREAEAEEEGQQGLIDRRGFLLTVGGASLALAAAGSVAWTYDYLWPNAVLEPPKTFDAGPLSEYKEGVDSRWLQKERIFVVRRQRKLYALIGICTHLGCIPPWRPDEGLFHCPCHGSEFSIEGDVLRPPAPEPLYRPPIKISADGHLIVGTGLLGIRLPGQANRDPVRSSTSYELRV